MAVGVRSGLYGAGLAACLCLCLVACLPDARAASESESRPLDELISDHPRAALKQSARWLAEAQSRGDKALRLRALRLSAMAHDQVEEVAELKDDAQQGLALAQEMGDLAAECEFRGALGVVAVSENRYADAMAIYNDAIALAEANNLPDNRARLIYGKGSAYLALGQTPDALKLLQEAHAYFEQTHNTVWLVGTLSAMATAHKGDPKDPATQRKAIAEYERALALIQDGRHRYDTSTLYHNLGVSYAALKENDQARAVLEKAVAIVRELDDPVSEAYLRYRLGQLARDQRRYPEALADFDRALPVFEQIRNANMQLWVQLARARALAAMERRRDANDALTRAQALKDQIKTPNSDAAFFEASADVHARNGEFEKAYRDSGALRDAERRRAEAANAQQTAELQTRFDVQQKDHENNLLRARAKESDARRLALILALLLSLLVLGGVAYFLVRNMRRNQQLANLAMKDDLTELPNRRAIIEFGQLQFRRRRGGDRGLCIALIDIDHFKSINDDFGHDRGDAVLIAFAATCQQQLRSGDRIGRFGGEEFLLIMPGSEISQIATMFERLRYAVSTIRVEGLPTSRRLTFSMGASTVESPLDTLDSLIKRADQALYHAKQSGRDRLELGLADGTAGPCVKMRDVPPPATSWVATPEHQALLKYEAILNNASVGIAFTRDRVFQHANPAFEDMFGWPRGGIVGQPGIAVWGSPEEYEEMGRAVGPLLSAGKPVELERKMKRRSGELFWCRLQARPIDPQNPAKGGTIWIIEDVTEQRNALERLHQLNEELTRANARLQAQVDEQARVGHPLKSEI
jgi:diguanylate cyclase (GGDEF)-like protein/PAS domain S-box-containing protein